MALTDWNKKEYDNGNLAFESKKNPKKDYLWIHQENYPIKNQWHLKIDTKNSNGITHMFNSKNHAIAYANKYMIKYDD